MLDLVALSLSASANCESFSLQLVKNSCAYYHYLCDKTDDRVSASRVSIEVHLGHTNASFPGLGMRIQKSTVPMFLGRRYAGY